MSSSTSTSDTATASTAAGSTVRSGLRVGEQVVAVRFGAWGPQQVTVRAYSDGGREGAPYVAVGVGPCLTYAYDQAAVDSYVLAWEAAERLNRTVRLPDFTPTSATRRHLGEDLGVLCNVTAEQRSTVLSSTGGTAARSSASRSARSRSTCTPPAPCGPT